MGWSHECSSRGILWELNGILLLLLLSLPPCLAFYLSGHFCPHFTAPHASTFPPQPYTWSLPLWASAPSGGPEGLILGASARSGAVKLEGAGLQRVIGPWNVRYLLLLEETTVCLWDRGCPLCTLCWVSVGRSWVNAWVCPCKVVCERPLKSLRPTWRFLSLKDRCMQVSQRGSINAGSGPPLHTCVVGMLCGPSTSLKAKRNAKHLKWLLLMIL